MNNNVKSATVAGLLGIFLGAVGAHDWYLGDKKKGIIHVCLAASGLVVSLIASALLPAILSFRTLLQMSALLAILGGIAAIIMAGNGIWGFIEGIIILAQGDAGLARKGYMVAQPSMGYGNNGYNNGYNNNNYSQPMNNNFGGPNMGNGNMNNGGMNGMGGQNPNGGNMSNGDMNGGNNTNGGNK